MEILGIGVLLKGRSGIGKSETALTLIDRGNYLVADDVIILALASCGKKVLGTSPKELEGLLEVRGLGILNIAHLLGDAVLKKHVTVDLMVHLVSFSQEEFKAMNRAELITSWNKIFGIPVLEITLPIFPGRNIPLLVEAAVRYSQRSNKP